jgi:hypothetical protein
MLVLSQGRDGSGLSDSGKLIPGLYSPFTSFRRLNCITERGKLLLCEFVRVGEVMTGIRTMYLSLLLELGIVLHPRHQCHGWGEVTQSNFSKVQD